MSETFSPQQWQRHFCLTAHALTALQQKNRSLAPRLRQILLLWDSSDAVSQNLRTALLTPDNLQALLQLQLIEPLRHVPVVPAPQSTAPDSAFYALSDQDLLQAPHSVVSAPTWRDTQQLMIESLQKSCGLLAAGLSRDIQNAFNIDGLRRCQARWKMTLLEARYPRAAVLNWIDDVNAALE